MPVLDVVQLLQNSHGDNNVVLVEGCHCGGVMQQHIGIQNIRLLDDGLQCGFFYAQG